MGSHHLGEKGGEQQKSQGRLGLKEGKTKNLKEKHGKGQEGMRQDKNEEDQGDGRGVPVRAGVMMGRVGGWLS